MHFRYSRWDGTQDPFGPDVPAAEVLEELADEILMGGGADHALQRLLRRGMQGRFTGIDALRQRLQRQREREESLLDLAGPLEDIRQRLEEIVERERSELSFRDDDDARAREAFLDALPPDAPGAIGELREYRFVDPGAQQHVRRAAGAHPRAGDGLVLPTDGRRHAEHDARGHRAVQGHAGRAERPHRDARREATTRSRPSTTSCRATATSSPTDRRRSTSCWSRWHGAWPR